MNVLSVIWINVDVDREFFFVSSSLDWRRQESNKNKQQMLSLDDINFISEFRDWNHLQLIRALLLSHTLSYTHTLICTHSHSHKDSCSGQLWISNWNGFNWSTKKKEPSMGSCFCFLLMLLHLLLFLFEIHSNYVFVTKNQ